MAGLCSGPSTPLFWSGAEDVDARDKRGHDSLYRPLYRRFLPALFVFAAFALPPLFRAAGFAAAATLRLAAGTAGIRPAFSMCRTH